MHKDQKEEQLATTLKKLRSIIGSVYPITISDDYLHIDESMIKYIGNTRLEKIEDAFPYSELGVNGLNIYLNKADMDYAHLVDGMFDN